jgi:hypothetical protein
MRLQQHEMTGGHALARLADLEAMRRVGDRGAPPRQSQRTQELTTRLDTSPAAADVSGSEGALYARAIRYLNVFSIR